MGMMKNSKTFVISDTHFFHRNIISHSGRPFGSVEEMNTHMVEKWNARVGEQDKVFHLGDVAMWGAKQYEIVRALRGRKTLILGNHDTQPMDVYQSVGFERVLSCYEGNGYVLTHVPVHEGQLARWGVNVHGHIHQERVGKQQRWLYDAGGEGYLEPWTPDDRYRNVCVEQISYTPVLLSEVVNR